MDRNNFTTPEREKGQHLGFAERCSIKTCKKLGLSLRKIADVVNCSASTVLNELRRGTGVRNGDRGRFPEYSAMRGQANYQTNRSRCHKQHKLQDGNPFINWMVKQVREKCWSLDICVGYARVQKLFPKECIVCSKTLYNELWAGNLPLTPFDLPEALSRKPRKCNVRKNRRILGKSIDERPEEAMMRIVYGHWEIDTVVGKRASKESAVLTLVEKVSDFYLAIKIPGRDSASVMAALEVLGKNTEKSTSLKSSKPSQQTMGLSLKDSLNLKIWAWASILHIPIHHGNERRMNVTTVSSAGFFPKEYP